MFYYTGRFCNCLCAKDVSLLTPSFILIFYLISLFVFIFQVKKIKTEAMSRSIPQPTPSGDPVSRPSPHLPDRSSGAGDQFHLHSPDGSVSHSADSMNMTMSPARSTETFNRSVYI